MTDVWRYVIQDLGSQSATLRGPCMCVLIHSPSGVWFLFLIQRLEQQQVASHHVYTLGNSRTKSFIFQFNNGSCRNFPLKQVQIAHPTCQHSVFIPTYIYSFHQVKGIQQHLFTLLQYSLENEECKRDDQCHTFRLNKQY